MLIKLYIYQKSDGAIRYADLGDPTAVVNDIPDDCDFTLIPPPDNSKVWRWVDDHWE